MFDTDTLVAFAYGLGSEALPAFIVAMVVLLWTLSGIWGLAAHYWVPRLHGRWPPTLVLALHVLLGFALIVATGGLFVTLAGALGDGGLMGKLDDAFSGAIRDSVSVETLSGFALITRFGDTATLIQIGLVVSLGLALLNKVWLIAPWVIAQLGNGIVNTSLKHAFERVRPVHEHGLAAAQGWSFPSGHTSGAVVTYGMLAYLLLRLMPPAWVRRYGLPVVLVAVGIAFATACSRVFLQVHFFSDVLAGFASGTAWLLLCICGVEVARVWFDRRIALP